SVSSASSWGELCGSLMARLSPERGPLVYHRTAEFRWPCELAQCQRSQETQETVAENTQAAIIPSMSFAPTSLGSGGSERQDVSGVIERAIEQCRKGNWDQGLPYLGQLASSEDRTRLPGLFYSYLGYGIALREQRVDEGLKLCKHAIKIE